jgi:hypothetical protein
MPDPTDSSTSAQQAPEDSFFILRDCRELFQRRLAEIARQSGISSSSVVDAFIREIGDAHDELASSDQQDGFEQTNGLTASRITLVGNDDLELDIRIGEIANRLKGNERIGHWRVQLRYMTLLHRPKMTAENNPVGLDPISRGLWAICRASGNKLDQNLDQLDRLEAKLLALLPDVYVELSGLLERHRVEPAQAKIVQRAGGAKPPFQAGVGSSEGYGDLGGVGGRNALSDLQQALRKQFGAGDPAPAGHTTGHPAGGSGNVTLDVSTIVMLNHLMDQLRGLELRQLSSLDNDSSADSGEKPRLHTIKSKDLDLPLGKPAAIALDTLSLIFECIFAAPDLPDVVKAAIGRLQIPLLKLAITDASFFADTQHPARRLVNRMARAAIGLDPDTGRDHVVCDRLGKLADAVRSTLEKTEGELTPYLEELDALIVECDQSIQVKAQPYVQLVLDHEVQESARTNARNWLGHALEKSTEPAIRQFLADYWQRVMVAACLDGGISGTRWQECAATIVELNWSVQPKPTADERKRLIALIPSLLKRINTELDRLDISTEERTPFVNACFDLQTAAMRSRPGTPDLPAQASAQAPAASTAPFGVVPASPAQILELNGKLVQYIGLPTETKSPWRTDGHAWKEGDWISFLLPDGERLCGRICWQGSLSGTVLLFNTGWGYAVALAPSSLEQQLRDGRARIVSATSLFDEAASQALGQITKR